MALKTQYPGGKKNTQTNIETFPYIKKKYYANEK